MSKKRKYDESYVKYGFCCMKESDDVEKPQCFLCGKVLANASMKPAKLIEQLKSLHPENASKDLEFFTKKKTQFSKSGTLTKLGFGIPQKPLVEASFRVAYRIAKSKKPHTIGETLIKPCALEMVELVCGLEQRKKLEAIPLSNDVIQSRIVEISCNILKQIINELKASPFPFSMQLDETTDISNCSQLLLFVRYVSADTIKEEFLFCEPLLQTTKAVDVLAILNVFFSKHDFDWKQKLHSLCTDGAPAMLGNKSGFAHLVKKEAPNVIVTHCFLHRHALATKTLPTSLIDVLSIVIKTVNFIRSRALNHRLFKTLCQEMNAEHEGPDTTIMDATEKLQAFLSKMSVWKIRIQNGIYANFQMLDEFIFENGSRQDSLLLNNLKDEICEHLEVLQVSFEKYFNLDEITKKDELWIRNPFLCDIDCIEDMDLAKDELIDLKTKSLLKMDFDTKTLGEFWSSLREAYP
ncbi:protein ZBED8 [Nephila pilipes]|uniref:Protein ZBED8 n=1 Tax=Nephila pilipes TaxID=299642 RepID=A0A8X6U034_NEPPI|nr:protein ZBED8 [Nephila pilipes]